MTVSTLSLCLLNFTKSFSSLFGTISSYVSSPMIINKGEFFDDEKKLYRKKSFDGFHCNRKDSLKYSTQKEKIDTSLSIQKKETNFSLINLNNKSKEEEISLLNINRLDYLPFFAAILYDRRSLLTMFIKILLQKVFLFRSLCAMSPFDMRTVNCSIYFLFIVLIFTFNALFFSNEMIVNQFPSDAFKRGIYALLPSAAIYLFL